MKTLRRGKVERDRAASVNEVVEVQASAQDLAGGEWLAQKKTYKPPDQLSLSDKALDEELTRILNANNPHAPQNIARWSFKEETYKTNPVTEHLVTHFEFEGHLMYVDEKRLTDEMKHAGSSIIELAALTGSMQIANTLMDLKEDKSSVPPRNRFNYSERATQPLSFALRSRSTNTEPPPHRVFAGAVNQWSIYDNYFEDTQAKEKSAQKTKKGQKEDEKRVTISSEMSHADDVYHSLDFQKRLLIMERMANQNMFAENAYDFKYWDDAADELMENKHGSLLPLWAFTYQKEKKKQVTALAWNTEYNDFFAVALGTFQFTKQAPGTVCGFSLKNPSFPEFVVQVSCGVFSLDFHPKKPNLLVIGLYDGSCMVIDFGECSPADATPNGALVASSSAFGSPHLRYVSDMRQQHMGCVWQVAWQPTDLDGNLNFFSVGADGLVKQGVIVKTDLLMRDVIKLRSDMDLVGTCFDFHKSNENIYIVGTQEGQLLKCSKEYNNKYLDSIQGHSMGVYRVLYNPFSSSVYLTASADWSVRLWYDGDILLIFDFGCPVSDIAWAPHSSTVFCVATSMGTIEIYDLEINKFDPICNQRVVGKPKLTKVAFNSFNPVLLVGDDHGTVQCLKLSPNLRKSGRGKISTEDQCERIHRIAIASFGAKHRISTNSD